MNAANKRIPNMQINIVGEKTLKIYPWMKASIRISLLKLSIKKLNIEF